MTPIKRDLYIYQGHDMAFEWSWRDKETKEPLDFAGASLRMQIRKKPGAPQLLYEMDSEDLILDDNNARVEIRFLGAKTKAYTFREGHYDLELFWPDDMPVYRLIMGSIQIDQEVTFGGD